MILGDTSISEIVVSFGRFPVRRRVALKGSFPAVMVRVNCITLPAHTVSLPVILAVNLPIGPMTLLHSESPGDDPAVATGFTSNQKYLSASAAFNTYDESFPGITVPGDAGVGFGTEDRYHVYSAFPRGFISRSV